MGSMKEKAVLQLAVRLHVIKNREKSSREFY